MESEMPLNILTTKEGNVLVTQDMVEETAMELGLKMFESKHPELRL